MGRILDEEIQLNNDDDLYEKYLREAREKVKPDSISDDEDGLIYWFFRCLYTDCRNHDFAGKSRTNYEEELRLAAESQVICEILNAREKALAV